MAQASLIPKRDNIHIYKDVSLEHAEPARSWFGTAPTAIAIVRFMPIDGQAAVHIVQLMRQSRHSRCII